MQRGSAAAHEKDLAQVAEPVGFGWKSGIRPSIEVPRSLVPCRLRNTPHATTGRALPLEYSAFQARPVG
jgi:hypothetical protein